VAERDILVCSLSSSLPRPDLVAAHGPIRPKEFVKKPSYPEGSDEDDSVVGKMPPTDESDTDT